MPGQKELEKPAYNMVVLTGIIGIAAAMLVGLGECFLHFNPTGEYADDGKYEYMLNISRWRITYGHFLAVLGTPLYLVGFYHIYLGTRNYGGRLPLIIFLLSAYGFIMGTVWIGSRSTIAFLVQANHAAGGKNPALLALIKDYIDHLEPLLWFIRVTTFAGSAGFIFMVWSNRTLYPRWMVFMNPIFLLIMSFVLLFVAPAVGKYTAPIALNAGYFVFFLLSTVTLARVCRDNYASDSTA